MSPPLRFFIFTTFLLFLFFFFFASASNPPNSPTIHLHDHTRNNYRSCSSLSEKKSRSLCIQLQRIHQLRQHQHSPPPPPSSLDEIDPRYGVEKRLLNVQQSKSNALLKHAITQIVDSLSIIQLPVLPCQASDLFEAYAYEVADTVDAFEDKTADLLQACAFEVGRHCCLSLSMRGGNCCVLMISLSL
ncbi:hypothetical protein QYF36_003047 [Acer negundo]|nr:hypothetical protein QYF36_003047 [Acer negundo]